ncbi:hypothetical protein [Nocardia abscessus]|uniref:hypothetical protein n=1 Tax=Nocardia abscessus TaxID=120957 RepID=UPI002456B717|nr:hypothetical protein [Nocardia abscessus]
MSVITPYIGQILGTFGTLAAAFAVWHAARTKARLDARTAAIDDEREDDQAADARWQAMLDQQRAHFEVIITPIQQDVESLRREVRDLHTALDVLRNRYRAAIDYIRALLGWSRAQPSADTMPPVPSQLADEV